MPEIIGSLRKQRRNRRKIPKMRANTKQVEAGENKNKIVSFQLFVLEWS